ncbi:hypothetical protein GCM10011390_09350 [Aureimonas endophytica]|uniref:Uncharacterized protein n=1 Tax=Aureimonas endophytica TaxID=2027858 RepID=A0A917E250_9HYPH|nr:hypothetical protein GCM10011390_09350 [Aureimonas endophytica]
MRLRCQGLAGLRDWRKGRPTPRAGEGEQASLTNAIFRGLDLERDGLRIVRDFVSGAIMSPMGRI